MNMTGKEVRERVLAAAKDAAGSVLSTAKATNTPVLTSSAGKVVRTLAASVLSEK